MGVAKSGDLTAPPLFILETHPGQVDTKRFPPHRKEADMGSGNHWDQDGPYIEKAIKFKAMGLVVSLDLPTDEVEDIKQELRIDLLKRLPLFDQNKASRKTFITRLLQNQTASLWEKYTAAKRDPRKIAFSFDEEIEGKDGGQQVRSDGVMSNEDQVAVFGQNDANERDLELRLDIQMIISLLPSDQRLICLLLAKEQSRTSIAKALGISRPALHDRLKILKKRFANFDYKKTSNSPDTSKTSPVSNKYREGFPCHRVEHSKTKGGDSNGSKTFSL